MKYLLSILVIIATVGAIALPAMATDISTAQYMTKILVSNNSTTDYTNVVIGLTCNTTAMVDGGMISASATDIVLQNDKGEDVAVMPGNPGQPWLLFTDNISALKQQWKFLYSKGVSSPKVAYFPDTTGMIIGDSPTLELGSIFTIYFPIIRFDFTQIGGIIFQKPGVISCNVTGSSNITLGVYSGASILHSITVNGISNLDHEFKIESDEVYLKIYIDGVLVGSKKL